MSSERTAETFKPNKNPNNDPRDGALRTDIYRKNVRYPEKVNLDGLLRKRRISHGEFGAMVGVTEKAVEKWVYGTGHMPSKKVALAAIKLGVSVPYLLDLTNDPDPESIPTVPYYECRSRVESYARSLAHSNTGVAAPLVTETVHGQIIPVRREVGDFPDDKLQERDERLRLFLCLPGDYRDLATVNMPLLELAQQTNDPELTENLGRTITAKTIASLGRESQKETIL